MSVCTRTSYIRRHSAVGKVFNRDFQEISGLNSPSEATDFARTRKRTSTPNGAPGFFHAKPRSVEHSADAQFCIGLLWLYIRTARPPALRHSCGRQCSATCFPNKQKQQSHSLCLNMGTPHIRPLDVAEAASSCLGISKEVILSYTLTRSPRDVSDHGFNGMIMIADCAASASCSAANDPSRLRIVYLHGLPPSIDHCARETQWENGTLHCIHFNSRIERST